MLKSLQFFHLFIVRAGVKSWHEPECLMTDFTVCEGDGLLQPSFFLAHISFLLVTSAFLAHPWNAQPRYVAAANFQCLSVSRELWQCCDSGGNDLYQ